ncbi:Integrase core domain-containing protein [Plantibacter sp. VKM Ac-1784]|uniref:Integrase core domain-containing protein n=1 Tax=Plantibacter elymi (nom. nud.) TaxID=199708 RepID=A0ABY1R801_9MICO|nr:DDE-type integrase/transposase/recombinase [Plantibacter sp. VKM Ac-1784]SMQ58236.1 Integrase core domain-containing protein [Plantibacter sp. VKM Ac-1784]
MSDIRVIRPGIELNWDSHRMLISSVGAHVVLTRLDGSHPIEVPIANVAASLRGNVAPSDRPYLRDVDERMTDRARARRKEKQDLLHLLLTGKRADQPDSDPPAPALDPARVHISVRRRRIAVERAQHPRGGGSMKGQAVLVKSEMKYLQRLEAEWRSNQTFVDKRYLRQSTSKVDPAVLDALYLYLEVQARRSSVTTLALVRGFKAHSAAQFPPLALPSDSTLWNYISKIRRTNSHLGGTARNRVSQMNVPTASSVPRLPTRPGELVLVDTTRANVWVKDPRVGKAYRLDVTLAIDLATRCIVGLAVTHTTTQFAIGLCLADVLRPKTSPLASEWAALDETFDQPFIGRPDAFISFHSAAFHPEGVVVDNGKPYVTDYVANQMARLGISYEPQRSYNPTDKAQVERVFRTIKDMFESQMPGFTGGSVHERGERPEAEDLMTAGEYERRLRQCIDLYNHKDHDGLVLPEDPFARLSPYMMYGILMAKIGAIPDLEYNFDWVRFLPSTLVAADTTRLRACRLNFKSPVLKELQSDPSVVATGKIRVYYDPFDLRIAWCFDSEGGLHPLRWSYLREDTPRFGEFHTNWAVKLLARKRVSAHDIERILLGIFAGQYDGTAEPSRLGLLADDLMEAGAAALAAGLRDDPAGAGDEDPSSSTAYTPPTSAPQPRRQRPRHAGPDPEPDERSTGAAIVPDDDDPEPRPRQPLRPYDPDRW